MNIEHVALQVPDPAAMADWYVNHLGCSIKRSTGEPAFIRFLMDGSGDAMMELYRNPRVAVPDYQSMDPMLVHIAFVGDHAILESGGHREVFTSGPEWTVAHTVTALRLARERGSRHEAIE